MAAYQCRAEFALRPAWRRFQNGLIDQGTLFAAFAAWTRDKARPLADHLVDRRELDASGRAVIEALADLHVEKHGDALKSLAGLDAGRSTRESLASLGDPELSGTLTHIGSAAKPGRGRPRF